LQNPDQIQMCIILIWISDFSPTLSKWDILIQFSSHITSHLPKPVYQSISKELVNQDKKDCMYICMEETTNQDQNYHQPIFQIFDLNSWISRHRHMILVPKCF
jgi:hypothetical protein